MADKPTLSKRAIALNPSLTLAISARAKALAKEGRDICSLSAGEPDFNTPEFIVEAAVKALRDGITRYGPAAGDPELREAIANKLTTINKIPTSANEVLITNGGKQAIYNLCQVILDPGDEVLIPAPYWLSYPEITLLAGGLPKIINSSYINGFKFNLKLLEESITEKSKLLILNSPSNPTGKVATKRELIEIAKIVIKHPQLSVISDEIYEFLLAEGEKHYSFASIAADMKDRVFTVNGFAKGWAMTGWRIGYLAGNCKVIKAAIALQSQSTSNVCSFAQKGALAALKNPLDCVLSMSEIYNYRRNLLVSGLKNINDLNIVEPKGAFYAFPKLPDNCLDSIEFCKLSLERYGLALIPGTPFGAQNCIRISCAVSDKRIIEGLNRLNLLLKHL